MPLTIGSQYLWFNNYVNIDSKVVYFREFSDKKIYFVKDILDDNGNLKTWESILHQHKMNKQLYYKWLQLIHATRNLWGKEIVDDNGNCKSLLPLNHHLIKINQLHDVEKLN